MIMPDSTYQAALDEFTQQLRGFFVAPEGAKSVESATRGGGAELSSEVLASRAEILVDASARLGNLTVGYLDAEESQLREAAEMKLLAQANAQAEVALNLLQTAMDESQGRSTGVTRSSRTASSQQAIGQLLGVLETPLEQGLQPFVEKRALRGAAETDPAAARQALQDSVRRSLKNISRKASQVSSLGLDTLFNLDDTLLKKGVALVSKDLADLIDKVVEGFNALLKRLTTAAMRLLLQAYDWVLALIGKDSEQAARQRVQEWIDQLRQSHQQAGDEDTLASQLVEQIYVTKAINDRVAQWLLASQMDAPTINQTADGVDGLSARYEAKINQVASFLKVASVARSLPLPVDKLPYIQLAVAAVVLGLLGYTLFSGYDYVDSGSVNFFNRFQVHIPDRVEGVSLTVQKALKVQV
jgi:DNA-binding transcriptional regulator YdaS (Cro superfamily)